MYSNNDPKVRRDIEAATDGAPVAKISRSWFVCRDCPSAQGCEDMGACRRTCESVDAKLSASEADPLGLDLIRGGKRVGSSSNGLNFKTRKRADYG
jgi:hypothetical protein